MHPLYYVLTHPVYGVLTMERKVVIPVLSNLFFLYDC